MTHERNSHSDVLQRIRTFESPHENWQAMKATDSELRRYGFPRRPDPAAEPRLHRLWTEYVARNPRRIQAELAIDPIMSKRNPLLRKGAEFGPSGWGGVVVETSSLGFSPPEPANTVFAKLQVPGIWPTSDPSAAITAGFWVGLDGFNSPQVLQAGIAVTVSSTGQVTWWAWTEWYTNQYQDPAVAVTNFPVSPGDVIGVLVCAPTSTHGFISLDNETSNVSTSIGIDARPNISLQGVCAEWIVEGISPELPVFCPMNFTACTAGSQHHSYDLQPDGFTTEIGGSSGALTATTISTGTSLVIDWEGLS